ncbi:MAG: 2-aminoethylphosphonate--pyruvate transaminase [Gammaproteobacteria bacterium]
MADTKQILFTPGPLTTSTKTKESMLRDLGSRDEDFARVTQEVRQRLLNVYPLDTKIYTSILLPGSGTTGIESVLSSTTHQAGKWFVIINGAYGKRIANVLEKYRIAFTTLENDLTQPINIKTIEKTLKNDKDITHVAIVHCETTTGIINDIHSICKLAKKYKKVTFIDAMSSFGALPIHFEKATIDFLVTSPNKCLESVPGFSIIIAKKAILKQCEHFARTYSLDLYAQWESLAKIGQFRFTPPTHTILALQEALSALEAEGGTSKRLTRYQENQSLLMKKMRSMGFETYLPEDLLSPIITTFKMPKGLNFAKLYSHLKNKGFIVYSGKLENTPCFRIGTIGHITPKDVESLTQTIERYITPEKKQAREKKGKAPPKPNLERLEDALMLAGNYLMRSCQANGKFRYNFRPDTNSYSREYNLLRHAGTTYSMLELYTFSKNPQLLQKIRRALFYLLRQIKPMPSNENIYLAVENNIVKLGGNALATLAFSKYAQVTGDQAYTCCMKSLAEFFIATQKDNGDFGVYKMRYPKETISPFISEYYPGETIFALCHAHRVDPQDKWLDCAEKASDYLIEERDANVAPENLIHDHWLLYGLNELYRERPHKRYLTHAFNIVDAIIASQHTSSNVDNLDWIGGFYKPPRSTPTATRAEGLCAAYRLAQDFGNPSQLKKILDCLEKCVSFQIQTQFTNDNTPSDMALGGFHRDLSHPEIRIDYVQHNISAILSYYQILKKS